MPLTGAIFRVIRDCNGTTVGEFTTDSAGEVTSLNLLKDTYKIKEIKAPAGY
nr:prealbumin-like fold domain-containing protein [Streptococcus constellatus]